jgi:hypothetical protein
MKSLVYLILGSLLVGLRIFHNLEFLALTGVASLLTARHSIETDSYAELQVGSLSMFSNLSRAKRAY